MNQDQFKIYKKYIITLIRWPLVCKNFWLGFFAFLNFFPTKNKYVTYKLHNGLNLIAQPINTDFQIIREIFVNHVYFKNFPLKNLNPQTIIDAGAHKGYTTIDFAHRYPHATIYAIEPDTTNRKIFEENLKKNKIHQVTILPNVIASQEGEQILYQSAITTVGSSLYHELLEQTHAPEISSIKVKAITLQQLIKDKRLKKIDIIKLDIEGAEYDVIFNTPTNIINNIHVFMIEAHHTNQHTKEDLINFFQKLHFTVYFPFTFENVMIAINPHFYE